MWWFSKGERKEIWDEEIQWPIGDIEAAHRIREICRSAAAGAGKTAGATGGFAKEKSETQRRKRAAKVAMEIAIKISDDLLRDSSVRQIVGLCITVDDFKTAQILFRAIQAPSIRQDLLNQHPTLREWTDPGA